MEGYKCASQKIILIIMMIMTFFLGHMTAFPVNLPGQPQGRKIGQTVRVSSRSQLTSIMNHTVPAILTAAVNPYEYLELRGHNATGLNILPYLMSNEIGQNAKKAPRSSFAFQAPVSCPVTWMVNMESNRDPVRIQRAVCNGAGTTCLSDGRPSCEEFSVTYKVLKFLGIDGSGNQFWQEQYFDVPVACHCAGV